MLLHAKRVGRGKWQAFCPAHETNGKHRPSLSIGEGRKSPIVFKCMSQGCSQDSILAAMGLTWKDVLGERDVVAPEVRRQWAVEAKYREWLKEWSHAFYVILTDRPFTFSNVFLSECLMSMYWRKRDRMYPEEAAVRRKRERVYRAIKKWGWDAVIEKWEQTERGKAIVEEYGVKNETS